MVRSKVCLFFQSGGFYGATSTGVLAPVARGRGREINNSSVERRAILFFLVFFFVCFDQRLAAVIYLLLLAASISVLWGAIYLLLLAASISDFLRRDIFAVIHSFNQRFAFASLGAGGGRATSDLGRLSVRHWREWLCAPP